LLITILSLVLLNFVINAAQRANGFVVLSDSMAQFAHFKEVAGIINLSIAISLAIWWLCLCIAGIVRAWQLFQYLRKRRDGTQQPAAAA
jgi:hypothetical protein